MTVTHTRRFIPGHMTEKAVKERLTKLMETDWRAKAEAVLKQNMKMVEKGEEAYVNTPPSFFSC